MTDQAPLSSEPLDHRAENREYGTIGVAGDPPEKRRGMTLRQTLGYFATLRRFTDHERTVLLDTIAVLDDYRRRLREREAVPSGDGLDVEIVAQVLASMYHTPIAQVTDEIRASAKMFVNRYAQRRDTEASR